MLQREINFRKMEWKQPMEGVKQKVYRVGKKQIPSGALRGTNGTSLLRERTLRNDPAW
jgi:hypothetical protein